MSYRINSVLVFLAVLSISAVGLSNELTELNPDNSREKLRINLEQALIVFKGLSAGQKGRVVEILEGMDDADENDEDVYEEIDINAAEEAARASAATFPTTTR